MALAEAYDVREDIEAAEAAGSVEADEIVENRISEDEIKTIGDVALERVTPPISSNTENIMPVDGSRMVPDLGFMALRRTMPRFN
jgi:hypothetical protein